MGSPAPAPVVVTGLGVVSALGTGTDEHFRRLFAGDCGVTGRQPGPHDDLPVPVWAPVQGFQAAEAIRNRMLRKLLRPSAAMAVVAAGEALRDAGLEGDAATLEAAGLYVGSVSFDLPFTHFLPAIEVSCDREGGFDFARFATRGLAQIDPLLIVKGLPNAGLCGIAIEHGVLGPNMNVANGAIGGLQAVAAAAAAIRRGTVEVALAGGYDSLLLIEHMTAAVVSGRLPGDDTAAGYALGEGAAICVLESAEHARRRGARVYAGIVGEEETTLPAENGHQGLELAARQLLARSGPAGVPRPDVVFGDLTGRDADDAGELCAAARLLGPSAITGAVGALGFTGAACGAFSLVHAARAIAEGRVPPTVGGARRPAEGPSRVVREAETRPMPSALVWRSDRGVKNLAVLLAAA